jgi:hypothetical protein
MNTFSDKTQNLFLEVNPNIDEIVKEEQELNEEATIEEKQEVLPKQRYSHQDVLCDEETVQFSPKKKKVIRKRGNPPKPLFVEATEETVQFEATQGEATPFEAPPEPKLSYREQKKLETKKRKEEEKQLKEEVRLKRKKETQERNRQKARERYWTQKQEKDNLKKEVEIETPKKIVERTTEKLNNLQRNEIQNKVSNNMDFAQFSSYMLQYEQMKQYFKTEQEEEHKKKQKDKQQEKQQEEQKINNNYPYHLLYGRKRQNKNIFF